MIGPINLCSQCCQPGEPFVRCDAHAARCDLRADFRRGSKIIRTWGDLGLNGSWSNKPIQRYGFNPANDEFARFFEDAVMVGSRKWNCEMHGFSDIQLPDGSLSEAGQQIVAAVAEDRYAIGYSSLLYRNTQVKPLALAPAMRRDRFGLAYAKRTYKLPVVKPLPVQAAGSYFRATENNIIHRKYPLARTVSIFINRAPGKAIDARTKEYLITFSAGMARRLWFAAATFPSMPSL